MQKLQLNIFKARSVVIKSEKDFFYYKAMDLFFIYIHQMIVLDKKNQFFI